MNYYNNFEKIELSETNNQCEFEYGILEKEDNIFYVNNKEIENNRALINDIVYINDNKVINIKKRKTEIISGILCLNSKMKYGVRNKKLIYLFKPNNKKLPYFYVCSSSTLNAMVYCIIEFKSWEINEKQPFGNIIEIFGEVGILENEYKNLLYFYNIFNKTSKFNKTKLIEHQEMINNIKKVDYTIFCIDPEGSKDLDDGFHYIEKEDFIEIGIHIACPYKFLNEKQDLEEILKRVTTIYLSNNINLIPNIYSENLCSFIEKNNRFSLSIILQIKNNKLIHYKIEEKIVYVTKNFHYEEFDKIYRNNENLVNFINTSKLFFQLNEINSHIFVEKWMIYANKIVAESLVSSFNSGVLSNIILRVHHNKNVSLGNPKNITNEKLIHYLKCKQENSAQYEIYNNININIDNDNTNLTQMHSKMENSYYTHFTSPIRRSIDFLNQILLIDKKDLYTIEELQEKVNHINNFEKRVKKFYRKKNRLDFIFNNKNTQEISTYGYITELNENRIRVYIPEYNLDENIRLYDKKISKIINKELSTSEIIQYIYENNKYTYNLYDKIELKLFILVYEDNIFEKIKFQIC
jgi:exoribonuclease R